MNENTENVEKAETIGLSEERRPSCRLVGEDGNAFAIMGRVRRALIGAGLKQEAEDYIKHATSGDYDNLLAVSMKYVNDDG